MGWLDGWLSVEAFCHCDRKASLMVNGVLKMTLMNRYVLCAYVKHRRAAYCPRMLFVFMALRLGWGWLSAYLLYVQIHRRKCMGMGVLSKILFDRCWRYLTWNVTDRKGGGGECGSATCQHLCVFPSPLLCRRSATEIRTNNCVKTRSRGCPWRGSQVDRAIVTLFGHPDWRFLWLSPL